MFGLLGSTRRSAVLALLTAALAAALAHAQVSGRSVNMVSGTGWPGGDPFLQRQNEPSVAVSTRNPMHILAGANDYRTVDLPGLPDDIETGDAWLGVFTSYNGGATWRSTLLPGYPQEPGSTSPLKGFDAAADPTVRAGTHGLFYYSGIAFDRDNPVIWAKMGRPARTALAGVGGATSSVFVARFIDNNNKENAAPPSDLATPGRESIAYLGTGVVATNVANPNVFLDKPWMAVDMPRKGAGTCTITQTFEGETVSQTLPAGAVYVAYSRFTGTVSAGDMEGRVFFARSLDCGESWSTPAEISGTHHINQGATIAIDPRTGTVYVAWRRFAWPRPPAATPPTPPPPPSENDAILIVRSFDRGATFTPPEVVTSFQPFDQGSAYSRFRTNAYPSLAVDRNGRVYVAFSARGAHPAGDARVVLTTARFHCRAGAVFKDEEDGEETAGPNEPKVVWSMPVAVDPDLSRRGHQIMPSAIVAGKRLQIAYVDMQEDHTWGQYARDETGRWVETRVLSEQRLDPGTCAGKDLFNPGRVDDSDVCVRRHTADVWVAQAEVGDSPAFVHRRVSSYRAGTRADRPETVEQIQFNPPNLPLFKLGTRAFWGDYIDLGALSFEPKNKNKWRHTAKADAAYVVFTDNRDVKPPFDGRWDLYTPPRSAALNEAQSRYDPTTAPSPCDPDKPERAGMRNQNIYAARVTQGLFVGVPGNTKPLGLIQRAFVVIVENATYEVRTFRVSIRKQPVGGAASFRQFSLLTSIDVAIAPRSSVSRTVFVSSSDAHASVEIDARETSGGVILPPATGGLAGSAVINPEMLNPEMLNPEMLNPEMLNVDVLSTEVHTPEMLNPEMLNPEMLNPEMLNPEMLNPEMLNPEMLNPEMLNPEMLNPEMLNTDLVNGSLTDTTWTITNLGNTTSAYDVRLLLRNASVPEGFKTQLILYKVYATPVVKDCLLREEAHNVLVASIPQPRLDPIGTALPYEPTDGSLQHATLWLAPGETARITLRVIDPDRNDAITFDPRREVAASALPHAVDSDDAEDGVTEPTPVTASPIVFIQGPTATPIGGFVTPPVQVLAQDETGAVIPGATVTLTLSANPGGATLHNETATTDALGIATFPDLWLDRLGSGYRLEASVGTQAGDSTLPFDVVPLVVTRTDDTDTHLFPPPATIPGSLRAALENANRNAGYRDEVSFGIPGPGPHTITLKHQGPTVTDPVVIDGTTQPGYAGTPLVRIECPFAADCIRGLWIQADNTTVRGLGVINTLGGGVFLVGATGALIEQNDIGTDGTADLGNGWGIAVIGGGSHTVRNNVVSGNDGVGIDLTDTSGNVIHGNRIGTNRPGTAALGNSQQGVKVSGNSAGNVIGGPGTGQGNLISGNVWGVAILGPAHDNIVEANRVGTNANGDGAIPNAVIGLRVSGGVNNTLIANQVAGNSGNGILIDSNATGSVVQSNLVGLNAAQTAALAHTGSGIAIGGTGTTANTLIANTVSGNLGHGVEIWAGAHHNTLVNNHIGTNSSGTASFGNQQDGVRVHNDGYANTIGLPGQGNTISGNGMAGITLNATRENVVLGNRIGTNDAGTTALPNAGIGVVVSQASLDRIGGAAAGDGNVISGNGGSGVAVVLASGVTIVGNRIGVDEAASAPVPNGDAGISANDVNTLTIGGATVGERNVVSGNVGHGLRISYCSVATVRGNFIGTNGAGTAPIPNGGNGISLVITGRVAIGGSAPGAGNLISGQAGDGLTLSNAQLSVVDGNLIGTNATGTGPVPNSGPGVRLSDGSRDNVIGGDMTATGNAISFNGGGGIVDAATTGTANAFGSNRIHSNTGPGIDLGNDGVTPNDATDPDTGPNDLLNFPLLTSAVGSGSSTTVSGSLNSIPGATFTIQLFSSAACDPSFNGEGEVFEGWTTVTTSSPSGDGSFSVVLPRNLVGRYITATTSTSLAAGGMTSEFSACLPTVGP